jgi:hypothetical protein
MFYSWRKIPQFLKEMERRVELYCDFIQGQQLQKHQLEQGISKLRAKIKTTKTNIDTNMDN